MSGYHLNQKYIYGVSDNLIVYLTGLSFWHKLWMYIKHPWKCETYFDNLLVKCRGNKKTIYADQVCYICGIKENLKVLEMIENENKPA